MKKILSIIFVSLFLTPSISYLRADSVSVSDAQAVAGRFFAGTSVTKATPASVKLVWTGSGNKSADAPFYVFNADKGFVIIAADKRMNPILGYSTSGNFDTSNIPDGLKALLDNYSRAVKVLRRSNSQPAEAIAGEWDKLLTSSAEAIEPAPVVELNTALWNQGEPYNLHCPIWDNAHCLTGCGPTAVAILTRYYKHPQQAYGPIPGYVSETHSIEIPAKAVDYSYQWDDMPLTYDSSSSASQQEAVATLMADIGQMLQVGYDTWSTWAYTNTVLPAMLTHLKYSNKATIRDRVNYSLEQWEALLKGELDAAHPVLYRGDSPMNGGHFYILDGYDSEGRFHFNWGWGGSSNGFFFFPDTDFSTNENAFIGLVPDYNWTEPTSSSRLTLFNNGSNSFGLWTSDPYIENNENFTLYVSFTNNSTTTYTGRVKVCLRHASGLSDDMFVSSSFSMEPYYYRWFGYDVSIPNVSAGDEFVAYYEYDGRWLMIDDGKVTLPLRYNIPDVLSMQYKNTGSDKVLYINGLQGMTLTGGSYPSGIGFSTPVLKLVNPATGDYTFSNGHDSYTVHLTF